MRGTTMTTFVTIDETSGAANDVGSNSLPYASGSFPAEFGSVLASLGLPAPDNVALSGYGASTPAGSTVMNFAGSVNDVAFTNATGGALAGVAAKSGPGATDFLKTTDGTPIFLYNFTTDLAGVDENNVLLGRQGQLNTHGTADTSDDTYEPDPNGAVVFAAYLDTGTAAVGDAGATAAKVWLVQYQPLYHPLGGADQPNDIDLLTGSVYVTVNAASNFSLAGAPSGQNAFLMFADQGFTGANADKAAVIVTGRDPAGGDTVNTGQGGGTTTIGSNNQMIDPKEGMYFTFVKGPNPDYTVPNLTQTEADVEANILFDTFLSTTGASFVLAQLQPPKGATLKLTALTDATTDTEHGTAFYEGLADDTQVNITSVTITPFDRKGVAGTPVTFTSDAGTNVTNAAMPGVSLDFSGNTVTLAGVHAGDRIAYSAAGEHNRVLIENAGNADAKLNASFDIGHFQIATGTVQQSPLGDLAFVDDAPAVTQAEPTDTAVLNTQDAETIGTATDSATESFAAAFDISASSYGADGAGSIGWSYALGVTADGESADMSSNGAAIYLYLVDGNVVGSTATAAADIAAANTVFDLAVSAAGAVTLRQFAEIDHAGPGDSSDYDAQQTVLGTGLVSLSATTLITDGDGDTASDTKSIDLGGNVVFDDHGPSITQAEPTDTAVLNTQDAETIGTATDSATESFAAAFDISASSYGADGAGSIGWSYALGVTADGESADMSSNGAAIYLYLVDGNVVGSTATAAADIAAANTVFDLAVSAAGAVTLRQFAEIDHAGPGDSSDYDAQQTVLGTGLVSLSATTLITDGDGDTASDTKSIDLGGNVVFDDHGPSASIERTVNTITMDETVGSKAGDANADDDDITLANADPFAGAHGTPIGALAGVDLVDATVTSGADSGGATTEVALAIVGGSGASSGLFTSGGTAVNLYLESDGSVTGRTGSSSGDVIFAVAIDGDGKVDVAQYAALRHSGTSSADDAVDLAGKLDAVVTETDTDGDTATASVGIGNAIVFEDDGPAVAFGNMVGTGTTVAQHGFWSMSSGSDGLGANGLDIALAGVTLIHPDASTSAGTFLFSELSPSPDASGNYRFGGTLTGDFDNDASTAATSTDFTLTAYSDGHYDLDLVQGFSSAATYDTADGLDAGGPDPVQTMTIPAPPATPQATVVFFSALVGATDAQILADVGSGASDPTEQQLQSPSLAAGIDARAMNVSLSGIGVSNNLLQGDASQAIGGTDESFVANPDVLCSSVTVVVDNSVGGYSYSGGERLYYRVVYDDGSMDPSYTLVQQDLGLATKGQPTAFTIATAPGKLIDAVQLTMASGDVKIPELLFTKTIGLVDTVKLDFMATVTDKDGDTATDSFSAALAPAQGSSAAFDFVLAGTASVADAFNVDLGSTRIDWQVTGFDTGPAADKLVFLGDAAASASVDNSGADSIVTISETGGQTTTVTVVGVHLAASDLSGLGSVSVL
jgi:hypothetical protein